MEYIRLTLGCLFLLIGLIVFFAEIFGIFKFDYLLNRMHVAAIGDTLACFSCLLGLMIMSGFSVATLKMIIVIISLWLTSPISSHLIAKMEAETKNASLKKYDIGKLEEIENELDGRKENS